MGTTPPQPPSAPGLSPDGNWFWTGTEWKTAISPDRRWRWTGYRWVPYPPRQDGTGAAILGVAIGLVLAELVILVVVSFIVIVILVAAASQIQNVFSNVQAALGR